MLRASKVVKSDPIISNHISTLSLSQSPLRKKRVNVTVLPGFYTGYVLPCDLEASANWGNSPDISCNETTSTRLKPGVKQMISLVRLRF